MRFACALAVAAAGTAHAEVLFQNTNDNGFLAPFGAGTPSSVRYGDGGWLSPFTTDRYELTSIQLQMCVVGSTRAGSTDITFTLNDGDPSGLVFGTGATLFSTTVTEIFLPAAGEPNAVAPVVVTIALPNVLTAGGFNNIGFSVGVENFDSDGTFGFFCASANAQQAGFYTSNASTSNGQSWSLFSFGPDPVFGVANYVATIEGHVVPAPGALGLLALALIVAFPARRSGRRSVG